MGNRINDASAIEARLLELAHTTDAKLTAPALAYFAPCSIDDASAVLEDLAARDRLRMDIEDDGTIVYHLLGRQRIEARPLPVAPAQRVLVPSVERPLPQASPTLAGLLSVFLPGAGHLYTGRLVAGVLWFFVVGAGYALLLPGLVLHLFSIASAAASAHRLNWTGRQLQLAAGRGL
ncbi:MAG: hypothetical protein M3680_25770 [Myxococcota bacterium]|nr:hypothetical protein [Myxococcota bacterium]